MEVQTQAQAQPQPHHAGPDALNGFDTATLRGLFDTLEQHSEGGRATFFSRSRWKQGEPGVSTRLAGYEIDGELQHGDGREHVVRSDEFTELGSTDTAPSPGELLMTALGSCITATARAYAATKGVRLTRVEVALESDMDLHGMFGLDAGVPPGVSELRAAITIAGEGDEEALREIALLGYRFSPARDTVARAVPIKPDVKVTR